MAKEKVEKKKKLRKQLKRLKQNSKPVATKEG